MQPTTYVTTTSFDKLYLSHYVSMSYKLLSIRLVGIMHLRMWPLILSFSIISPTMVMNTSHLLSSNSMGILMPKACQRFGLRDGFIYGPDLSAFQLCLVPIQHPIYEVEQHMFTCEVGNLKSAGGELLLICVYAADFLRLAKLEHSFIDDVFREERLLKFHLELLQNIDGATPFSYFLLFMPPL